MLCVVRKHSFSFNFYDSENTSENLLHFLCKNTYDFVWNCFQHLPNNSCIELSCNRIILNRITVRSTEPIDPKLIEKFFEPYIKYSDWKVSLLVIKSRLID